MSLTSCNVVVALPSGVETAGTFFRRTRGLLGRRGLNPGEGLLLVPCNAVHTLGMRFPIDVVFLGKPTGNGCALPVLGVREAVPPWRPWIGMRRAWAVLELGAGEARRLGLRPGVRVMPPEHGEEDDANCLC